VVDGEVVVVVVAVAFVSISVRKTCENPLVVGNRSVMWLLVKVVFGAGSTVFMVVDDHLGAAPQRDD
jgi:hypothetical protein